MIVEIRTKPILSALPADRYQVRVVCRNCDGVQFAVIEKGTMAGTAIRAAACAVCSVFGELQKAGAA